MNKNKAKNYKRIITFILAVTLVIFSFYSCSDSKSNAPDDIKEETNSATSSSVSSESKAEESEATDEKAEAEDEVEEVSEIELPVEDREKCLGTVFNPLEEGESVTFISHLENNYEDLKIKVKLLELSQVERGDLEIVPGEEEGAKYFLDEVPPEDMPTEVGSLFPDPKFCKMKLELEAIAIDEPLEFDPFLSVYTTSTDDEDPTYTSAMGISQDPIHYTFEKPENIIINEGETKTFTLFFFKGIDDLIFLKLPSETYLCIYYKTFDPDVPAY